jgi:carotenoid cleavage dioxygenase-like enzyme
MDASPYLAGNNAPVVEQTTALDLPVVGQIPTELEGRLLRNGPNPIGEVDLASHHWFLGDGMVHGIRIRGGKAEWYRNRYVGSERTQTLLGHKPEGPVAGNIGPNTNVIGHAGRTYAIVEAGTSPVELTYELETIRSNGFCDSLLNGYTAHPKYDPSTGEMHAVCYSWPDLGDKLQYVVVGPDGTMTKTIGVTAPTMPMVHDMALTQTYAVVMDLPVAVDFDMAFAGNKFPFRWFDDYNARVGLLPRDAASEDEIVWCEIDPCFAFHPLNAYDADDGTVIIDICEYDRIFDQDRNGPFRDSFAVLARWTVDPNSRKVKREVIDGRFQEFPRVAGSVLNRPHRFGYTTAVSNDDGVRLGATYKHDLTAGTNVTFDHGPGREAGEPVFVSRDGATSEDDGWLMTVVYDASEARSDVVILDALGLNEEIARIQLPARVPTGFHGNWVRDTVVSPLS